MSVAGGGPRRLVVDRMPVEIYPDGAGLAEAAAGRAAAVLRTAVVERGAARAVFATGNSQLAFVDALCDGDVDVPWHRVTVLHMDEYVGVGPDHPAGFRHWIRTRLADRVHPAAAEYLDGQADPPSEAARYAALLRAGPVDLCCLGIGENGHLAFNDPPVADFADPVDVKIVTLDDACRAQQVGEGHFPDVASVPPQAITLTIPALLRAGTVLAVVPEARKAEAVRAALRGPVTTACPASVLRTRDNVTCFLDEASAARL